MTGCAHDDATTGHRRTHRTGTLRRRQPARRQGVVRHRQDADFTPTELLLAAIGGCTAIDVDILTSRRAQSSSFKVDVGADKVRDDDGNRLTDITVTFRVTFPAGADGDAAREVLPQAVQRSHDRLCTVGRTVELGTPITSHIE